MDYTKQVMLDTLQKQPNIQYMELNEAIENGMKDFIKKYMRLIGSSNRYTFEDCKVAELD